MKRTLSLLLALILPAAGISIAAAEEFAEPPTPEVHTCGDYEYIVLDDGTAEIVRFTDFDYEGELVIPDTLDGIRITGIGDEAFSAESSFPGVTNPEKQIYPAGYIDIASDDGPWLQDGTRDWDNYKSEPAELPQIDLSSLNFDISVDTDWQLQIWSPDETSDPENGDPEYQGWLSVISDFSESLGGSPDSDIPGSSTETVIDDTENYNSEIADGKTIVISPDSIRIPTGTLNEAQYTGYISAPPEDYDPYYPEEHPDPFYQLTGVIVPEGVTRIGSDAFSGCCCITVMALPDSLCSIGLNAFRFCESLTEIVVPGGVTDIGNFAFASCISLHSVTLPDSILSIGSNPFVNCTGLVHINVSPFNPVLAFADGMLISKPDKRLVSCLPLAAGTVTVPDGTEIIGACAFSYCEQMTSVLLPDSVSVIGNYAFEQCASLTGLVIPGSVTYIGNLAFVNCCSLTEITIPGSVESIQTGVFVCCEALSRIRIMDGVRRIKAHVFEECKSLREIEIPASVTQIDEDVFSGCHIDSYLVVQGSYAETYLQGRNIKYLSGE